MDDQIEVVNRFLKSYLRCFASDEPNYSSEYIYLVEYWNNTSYHTAIEMPHFQDLYDRPPPSFPHYTMGTLNVASIYNTLANHQRIIQHLKETLQRSHQRMTNQTNKQRKIKEF